MATLAEIEAQGILLQAKDVCLAVPGLTSQVLHSRHQRGYQPVRQESQGPGQPNLYGPEETIQAGVTHQLAGFGLLQSKHAKGTVFTRIRERYEFVKNLPGDFDVPFPQGEQTEIVDWIPPDPFLFDLSFYRRHKYNVFVTLSVRYSSSPKRVEYHVHYLPESVRGDETSDVVETELNEWREGTDYGERLSFLVISVRRIYEYADWKLTTKGWHFPALGFK